MKNILRAVFFLAAAALNVRAAPSDFDYTRPVRPAPLSAPALAEIRLDPDLYANTRLGFPDLRLYDAAGTERPRLIEPLADTRAVPVRVPIASGTIGIQETAGNRIEARFEIDSAAPFPHGLDLRTPLRDFVRDVRVSGSDDGRFWKILADTQIYDYTRHVDVRSTEIALPSNACRQFLVEISIPAEDRAQPFLQLLQANGLAPDAARERLQSPFRISGASFWRTTAQPTSEPLLREWPCADVETLENLESRITVITFHTRKTPISRIDFETPARNFKRIATIQIPTVANDRPTWRTIGDGKLLHIDLPGIATNSFSVSFPEQRTDRLRVVIQNAGNPPIPLSSVRLFGPDYRLLWLASPATDYLLAYGRDIIPAPGDDPASLRAALAQTPAPPLASLAKPIPNPDRHRFDLAQFITRPIVAGPFLALVAAAFIALVALAVKYTT